MIHDSYDSLINDLESRLKRGLESGVNILQDAVPIDTKRAYMTIRASDITNGYGRITLGGEFKFGVLREQGILKPVDYVGYLEARTGFIISSLSKIEQAILDEF